VIAEQFAAVAKLRRRDEAMWRVQRVLNEAFAVRDAYDKAYFLGQAHGLLCALVTEFGADDETRAVADEIDARVMRERVMAT